jgi:hypothetical protein
MYVNVNAALLESKLRIQLASRRASLMATLGPAPELEHLPGFRRQVRPLPADFVLQHTVPPTSANGEEARKAA